MALLSNAAAVEQMRIAKIYTHARLHCSNPVEAVHSIVHQVFGHDAILHRVMRGWWKVAFVEKQRRDEERGFGLTRRGKFMYTQRTLEICLKGAKWDGAGVPPLIEEFNKHDATRVAARNRDSMSRVRIASKASDSVRQTQIQKRTLIIICQARLWTCSVFKID